MEVCSRGSCVIGRDSTRSALVQRTPLREAEYKIAMTESMSPPIPSDGGAEEHQTALSRPATTGASTLCVEVPRPVEVYVW